MTKGSGKDRLRGKNFGLFILCDYSNRKQHTSHSIQNAILAALRLKVSRPLEIAVRKGFKARA
jgi:hypothetical protein